MKLNTAYYNTFSTKNQSFFCIFNNFFIYYLRNPKIPPDNNPYNDLDKYNCIAHKSAHHNLDTGIYFLHQKNNRIWNKLL